MSDARLERISELLRQRNEVDAEIAALIDPPVVSGHLGEWIAAQVFDIALERSASATAIDGRFRSGPLANETVNVKWYLKREGLLDMTGSEELDHYLVMTGPPGAPAPSEATSRPWCIQHVYLFGARGLLAEQRERGVKAGTASSVPRALWDAAEIYPGATGESITLTPRQCALLRLFSPHQGDGA